LSVASLVGDLILCQSLQLTTLTLLQNRLH